MVPAAQELDAHLILPQGRGAPALPRVELHQAAVRALLQRVQREDAHGGLQCLVRRSRLGLLREQRRERRDGHLAEPRPLVPQPVLEGRLADGDPVEQVAGIHARRFLQRGQRPRRDEPLEGHHVHVDARRIERQRLTLDERVPGLSQGAPQPEERLAEAMPSVRVVRVRPQERGELVPRVLTARPHAEKGQQRLGLPGQRDRRARVDRRTKAAEHREGETLHDATGSARTVASPRKARQDGLTFF
jgi:hypothetical protein